MEGNLMGLEIPQRDEETAEFNNAFAFLERLNQIEYLIEDALMDWKLSKAFFVLESYENELAFCFDNKSEQDVKDAKEPIIKILNENSGIGQVKKVGGQTIIVGSDNLGELRGLLVVLNKTLRKIKHKKGMGMPSRSEGKLF